MKQSCLRCKYFKIEDPESGFCRKNRGESGNRNEQESLVKTEDSCADWIDCGQQYHIRRGWIKAILAKKSQAAGD